MKCQQHVLLMDTSGSFVLAVRLPTKDYSPTDTPKPKRDRRQQQRDYHNRPAVKRRYKKLWKKNSKKWFQAHKQEHNEYERQWRIDNPEKYRAALDRRNTKRRNDKLKLKLKKGKLVNSSTKNETKSIKGVRKNA